MCAFTAVIRWPILGGDFFDTDVDEKSKKVGISFFHPKLTCEQVPSAWQVPILVHPIEMSQNIEFLGGDRALSNQYDRRPQ